MSATPPYPRSGSNSEINNLVKHSGTFFDMSPIMLCLASSEGRFLDLNSSWETALGYTKDEMVGKFFMDFIYKDDIENTLKQFSRQLKGEEVFSFINRYCCKDGSVKWLDWRARTSADLKTIYASANDITVLKEAEKAIRISEENHRKLFNEMPLPSFIFDIETLEILKVNPQAISEYGYTLEEFLKLKLTDLWTDEDRNIHLKFVKSLKGESFVNKELKHKKKNGEIIDVQVSSHEILFNNRKARHVIINDITKEKRIMHLLQESEEKYRLLTEKSSDLIMRFDRNYRHLYASPSTRQFFNIEPEEFLGKTHEELGFKKEDCDYWHGKMDKVFESGKNHTEITEINDGETTVEWHIIPELDSKGNVSSIFSYSKDITEIIRAQKVLKESEEKLRELNADKDRFFSIIAHDMRGPLGNFKQITELMTDTSEKFSEDEIHHFVELMKTSSSNLYAMLENLLEWSLIQRNLKDPKLEEFKILHSIKLNLEVTKDIASKKRIELVCRIPEEMKVCTDVKMFNTIIRNILSNAVKFTPEDGVITISASESNGESVEISVEDTGIGMTGEMIENLFTKGGDSVRSGTAGEYSTGLGLVLCKEFAEKINSALKVESTPGKGTKFTLIIKTPPCK